MKPGWRSLLFVPANAPERWAKAHMRGADAIIVDLEDSTEPPHKIAARSHAIDAIAFLAGQGASVTVRINNAPDLLEGDLDAVLRPGLAALILPKVEAAAELIGLDGTLQRLEAERGLPPTSIVAVIESPWALEAVGGIASGPRLMGLALGSEDFSLSMERSPSSELLDLACLKVAYAAAARGLMGIGMPCGIGDYLDLHAWERAAGRAHAMGLTGAMAIHPAQIPALNRTFAPTDAQIAEAEAVIRAWEGRASGVVSLRGRMIDQPVVERARRTLASART